MRQIALERGPEGVRGLVVRAARPFARPPPRAQDAGAWDDAYALATVPPEAPRVLRAWDALGAVARLDADALADLLIVLLETVPARPPRSIPTPPPRLDAAERAPRRTAAHPRAYQGTKYKPPKPKLPETVDLRPHLEDPRHCRSLLAEAARHFTRAAARLEESGYSPERIALLGDRLAGAADAYVLYHFGKAVRLPFLFSRCILPSLRGAGWGDVKGFLSAYVALRLEERPALLAAIALLAAERPDAAGVDHCRLLARHPPERQPMIATFLIASGAVRSDPAGIAPEDIDAVFGLTPREAHPHWLYAMLDGCARGASSRYALAGIELASRIHPEHALPPIQPCADYDAARLALISAHAAKGSDDEKFPLWFWERCAALPGLAQIAERFPFPLFEPKIVRGYLGAFMGIVHHDLSPKVMRAKWNVVQAHAAALAALLERTAPLYRGKVLQYFENALWRWDRAAELSERLPRLLAIAQRVARAPFQKSERGSQAVVCFLEAPPALAAALEAAPSQSFQKLEKACRRRDNETLIAGGLRALLARRGTLTVRAFYDEPKRLLEVARTLGTLSAPARLAVDMGPDVELGFLDRVEQNALGALAEGFAADVSAPNVTHALAMLVDGEGNRRALRRFLKAYFAGDSCYVARHPATRAWLAKHGHLDERLWTEGIALCREIEGHGAVRVAIELDPLEALKLGTYVGSCLGLGGLCAYSAAAAVLDANKRVLYARTAGGRVLARQLVALSKTGELVGFDVYPDSAPPALKAMFRDYDLAFAEALGVAVHRPSPETTYDIEHILSHAWWDDGAGDLG